MRDASRHASELVYLIDDYIKASIDVRTEEDYWTRVNAKERYFLAQERLQNKLADKLALIADAEEKNP